MDKITIFLLILVVFIIVTVVCLVLVSIYNKNKDTKEKWYRRGWGGRWGGRGWGGRWGRGWNSYPYNISENNCQLNCDYNQNNCLSSPKACRDQRNQCYYNCSL